MHGSNIYALSRNTAIHFSLPLIDLDWSLPTIFLFVSYLYFLIWKYVFLILFSGQTTYPCTQNVLIMAAVLEHLFRQQKKPVEHCRASKSQKALELEAAREILAEVFGVHLSEVDEMIRNRFQSSEKEAHGEGHGPWPQEFWV